MGDSLILEVVKEHGLLGLVLLFQIAAWVRAENRAARQYQTLFRAYAELVEHAVGVVKNNNRFLSAAVRLTSEEDEEP